MKRQLSLSLRLTLWFCGLFLLGFAIFGLSMWFDLAYSLGQGRDRTLANRARRLEALLDGSRAETAGRRAAKFDDFAQATPEGSLIQVFDAAGQRVFPVARSTTVAFPWPQLPMSQEPLYRDVMYGARVFRVFAKTVDLDGRQLQIRVAGNLDDNRNMLRRFSLGLLWSIPASLAISTLIGYFVGRRALAPIAQLTSAARSITIGNLSRRLPVSDTGDELQQLSETCNEMLNRLEKALGEITRFTADASHELRSPLSVIRTTAECALGNPEADSESAEALREIVSESELAAYLLDDMLTLARSDAGRAEVNFEPLDLAVLTAEVCDKIRPLADARGHELRITAPDSDVVIEGDALRMRRLVWILIDNAIKYTPDGGHIDVSLRPLDRQVQLSVHDSGVGIPAEAVPRIFERFYRVDPSRVQEGTGLGLAIAKWIADSHRAVITVESTPGNGTAFFVSFPGRISTAR